MSATIPFASINVPKLRLPPFEDSQFVATKFSSSVEKAKFGNQLLRFIGAGFPVPSALAPAFGSST